MSQPELLQKTLGRLILRHPFLSCLALRLERIVDPTTATAWTDGIHLAINPTWFAGLSDDQRLACVGHECYHIALGHQLRRGQREPHRWNRACDYAVNALLHLDGFTLPSEALLDPTFGDASAEAIYNQLPPHSPASTSAGRGDDAPSGAYPFNSPSGAQHTPPANPASPPNPATSGGSHPNPTSPSTPVPAPDAGGSVTGPHDLGEVRDEPRPASQPAVDQQTRLAQHAVAITALAQQARAAGRDTAGVRRASAVAVQPPSVDWCLVLAESLAQRHPLDYSWRRPHSRYSHLGCYLPCLDAPAPLSAAFVIDTSGSVPASALAAVAAELEAYLQQNPTATLDVVYADAAVTGRASYTFLDLPLRLNPVGGGGTDFRPALAALAEDSPPPSCIVYLTDLEGRFPDEPPPIPLVWLVFGPSRDRKIAPFGKVLPLPY